MGKITLLLASQNGKKSVFSRGLAYVNRRRRMGQNDAFLDFAKMIKEMKIEIEKLKQGG